MTPMATACFSRGRRRQTHKRANPRILLECHCKWPRMKTVWVGVLVIGHATAEYVHRSAVRRY